MDELELSPQMYDLVNAINFGTEDDTSLPMPFGEDIFLIGTPIAGPHYVDNIARLYEGLEIGEKVNLIREPQNEHDSRAIRVETKQGEKLGYVPRIENLILSRLMDAGKLLYAVIRSKDINRGAENEPPHYNIVMKIYMRDWDEGTPLDTKSTSV